MGVKNLFDNILEKVKTFKQLDSFGFTAATQLEDPEGIRRDKLPIFPEWFWSARLGQPRQVNIVEIRQFAKSPWVQMVINTIKKEVMIIDWDIVNIDEDDEENHDEDKKKVREFLEKMNTDFDNILDLCNPVITDLGEIDAGAWVRIYSLGSYEKRMLPVIDDMGNTKGEEEKVVLKPFGQREMLQVRYADASTFLKQIDIWGRLQSYFQYSFKNPRTNPQKFEPDEVIYFQMNRRSYKLYGFSPVQAIQQVLEVLIQSTRWNKEFFKSNAIPDGIIGLEGANKESMKQFKKDWQKEFKGKAHKLGFHNTKVNFADLSRSSRDMEWLEGQKWYFHLVFGVYGVSPVEAGFHENVNQGNQAGQERVTVKNAIKPYLKALQNPINTHLVPEILQQERPKIMFRFNPIDHAEEKINFDNSIKEIQTGTLTINEYRKMRGRDEVEWGDTPSMAPDAQFGEDPQEEGGNPNNPNNPKEKPEEKPKPKDKDDNPKDKALLAFTKEMIDAGEDVIEESEDYAQFLSNNINLWKRKTLKAVEKLADEVQKDYTNKTFGEFLQGMTNAINSIPFKRGLRAIIKKDYQAGVNSAETEINVQIGFTDPMNERLKILEQQQIEGYTISGKFWPGIKGMSRKTQMKVLTQVKEDLDAKKGIKEISKNIEDLFETTKNQSTAIARTETTRFITFGKLDSYKDAKIPRKAYAAVNDDRTADICKRLHNKYFDKGIPVDEPFIDDDTGKSGQGPPFSHVNCRCVIEARTGDESDAENTN